MTIENICYTGIDPIVVPTVTIVESDRPNHIFVLVEVDESPQSPHAIENSTAVYVRSGAASRKELITLENLERLIKRRDGILRHRETFRTEALRVQNTITPSTPFPKFRLMAGPRLPHSHVTDRETVEGLVRTFTYGTRYTNCFTRRMPHGGVWFLNVHGYAHKKEFGYLDTHGQVFYQVVLDVPDAVCYLSEVAASTAYLFTRLERCYTDLGYHGVLAVEAELRDLDPGLTYRWDHVMTAGFASYGETLTAETFVAAERLPDSLAETVATLLEELLWPLSPSRQMTREQWREMAQGFVDQERRDFPP